MKKILLTFLTGSCIVSFNEANAQLPLANFNSGYPSTWSMIKGDANVPNSGWVPYIVSGLTNNAWMGWPRNSTGSDSCVITTSYFSSPATADRWMVTPAFTVTSANTVLTWEDAEFQATSTSADVLEIYLSTTGATESAFTATSPIYTGTTVPSWTQRCVLLGAYNGQTIRLGIRNNSNNQGISAVDNVQTEILPNADLALLSVKPFGDPACFPTSGGGTLALSGTVQNMGYNTVTSYSVSYQIGASAPVTSTQTASIAPLGTATFSGINVTIPTSITPIKVWVTLTGDANPANDSAFSQMGVPASFPPKKLFFEEPTGTWCGYCVRGIIYMDSIHYLHPNQVSIASVHDQDPMSQDNSTTNDYDGLVSSLITGYPSLLVDRMPFVSQSVNDPSNVVNLYNQYHSEFAFADIALTATVSSSTVSASVTVTPAITLTGDYRMELIVTENGVFGTGLSWDQHDYYSNSYTSPQGPMAGMGYNFQDSVYQIPDIHFPFVARYTIPDVIASPNGVAGSLPTNMPAGTPQTYTFSNINIPSNWVSSNLHVTALLIDNNSTDGGAYSRVLNSATTDTVYQGFPPLTVANVMPTINSATLYPNPATESTNLSFELSQSTEVAINVYDVLGRVVYSIPSKELSSGKNVITIPTHALANGSYNINIISGQLNLGTKRLTVVR